MDTKNYMPDKLQKSVEWNISSPHTRTFGHMIDFGKIKNLLAKISYLIPNFQTQINFGVGEYYED